jgi:hypothetical protein
MECETSSDCGSYIARTCRSGWAARATLEFDPLLGVCHQLLSSLSCCVLFSDAGALSTGRNGRNAPTTRNATSLNGHHALCSNAPERNMTSPVESFERRLTLTTERSTTQRRHTGRNEPTQQNATGERLSGRGTQRTNAALTKTRDATRHWAPALSGEWRTAARDAERTTYWRFA